MTSDDVALEPATAPEITLISPQSISHSGVLPVVNDWHPQLKMMKPIIVRKSSGNGYQLINGRRRLSIALKLKWTQIPAIIEPELKPVSVASKTELLDVPRFGGWGDDSHDQRSTPTSL